MNLNKKLNVGIIGATGMVGQRFLTLLDNHPMFNVTAVAASSRSADKTLEEGLNDRWKLSEAIPEYAKKLIIKDANEIKKIADEVDFVFCAVDMKKEEIKELEYAYAKTETPVISNNSAHRMTSDVPMVIPEVNPEHINIIERQRKRLGLKSGFIAVKPNCSLQSYVPLLTPLLKYDPYEVAATTYQAISGASKIFSEWPEMIDNVIPYISGEEEKSEQEPLKIWGRIMGGEIVKTSSPVITTQCIRVPVSDGHMAAVFVKFNKKPSKADIINEWNTFKGIPQELNLPSAPEKFITYYEDDARPQTALDRNIYNGMGITCGRLREDSVYDYKFIGLSHNTIRGAAGGAVLIAELLAAQGYITYK